MSSLPPPADLVSAAESSLLDLVDHVLNKGVSLEGEVVLGIADVDLVYLRLSALLCAADRVLPTAPEAAGTWPFDWIRVRPPAPPGARPLVATRSRPATRAPGPVRPTARAPRSAARRPRPAGRPPRSRASRS